MKSSISLRDPAIWWWGVGLVLLQAPATALAIRFGPLWSLLPIAMLGAALCLLQPRWGVLLLVFSLFWRIPLSSTIGVYPADLVLVLVVIGYILQQISHGRPLVYRSPLDGWVLLWMLSLLISVSLSASRTTGMISWAHHAQIFLLFFTLNGLLREIDARRVLALFSVTCTAIAVFNFAIFVAAGGAVRAFGPAGTTFSGYIALAVAFATVSTLFAESRSARRFWFASLMILLLGQVANQSRGALIQTVTGVAFVLACAFRWSQLQNQPVIRKRVLHLGAAGLVSLLIVTLLIAPLLAGVIDRYATQSGSPLATVQMRLFLWQTALRTFFDNPFFGIGLSQEHVMSEINPSVRFNIWYLATRGASAHNAFLGYLADSGLIGSVILLIMLIKAVGLGRGILSRPGRAEHVRWQLAAWGMVFVTVTRYLYEGHLFYSLSGVTAALLFSVLLKLRSADAPFAHAPGVKPL